jgi:transmembrane sensor
MKREISSDLLKKFLRGETTIQETAVVDEWYLGLQESPDDISLLDPFERELVQSKILDRIKSNIEAPKELCKPRQVNNFFFLRKTPFKLAAAITTITVIGLGAILFKQRGLPSLALKNEVTYFLGKKTANHTSSISRIVLEDGTIIMLQPNGSIEYPEKFSRSDRKIKLTGEAFFDVTKDKDRPFIISAADVTIKVLGTSFNVVAYEGSKEVSVTVKTGKVSVYARTNDAVEDELQGNEEVILTPNQEVIYNTTKENFSKRLAAQPQIILEKPTLFETQYDGAPVVKILNVLEENYGIDIKFDEQALSNCILTTSMSEEGLYERIEIICKAIGADYEITDTEIFIHSTGCTK